MGTSGGQEPDASRKASEGGEYVESPVSRFLPIRPEDISRWVLHEADDDTAWAREFRAWVREHLIGAGR